MKLKNEFDDGEIEVFGKEDTSVKAEIDTEDLSFLFDLVSNQLYSNPKGSIVREITSNCFDAHQAAGKKEPVIIKLHSIEYKRYISFIDFGTGLSPDQMNNIYRKYFKSTKRESNEFIGAFGLGSKSPLSYTDMFYIITKVDGIEYTYSFDKYGGIPNLDLLSQREVTDGNGTEIRIPVENYYQDFRDFRDEIKNQLAYFDDVFVVDNFEHFNNDYKILDCETFKFRDNSLYESQMHIVLGKVSYPIDWKFLGIDAIPICVAVKFNIGELQVTPSRESIRYDEESKRLILDRIKDVTEELKKTINNRIILDSIPQALRQNNNIYNYSFYIKDFEINVSSTYNRNTGKYNFYIKKPTTTIKGFEHISIDFQKFKLKEYIDSMFTSDAYINKETSNLNMVQNILVSKQVQLGNLEKFFRKTDKTTNSRVKNFAICTSHTPAYILKKNKRVLTKSIEENLYSSAIGLKKKRGNKTVKILEVPLIQTFKALNKAIQSYIVENTYSYDKFVITEEHKRNYKLTYARVKVESEGFVCKEYVQFKVEKDDFKVSNLKKGQLVIYGTADDKETLKEISNNIWLSRGYISYRNVLVIECAKKHHKILENVENAYLVEDFIKSNNNVYKKVATSLLIRKIIDNDRKYNIDNLLLLDFVNEDVKLNYVTSLKVLEEDFNYTNRNYISNPELSSMILQYAKDNNLFDLSKLNHLKSLLDLENKFKLLSLIDRKDSSKLLDEKTFAPEVRKYLKANKLITPILKIDKEKSEQLGGNINNLTNKIYGYSEITHS